MLEQEGVNLRLASGKYDAKAGPLQSYTPVISIIGEIAKGKRVQFTASPGYWTLLYLSKGRINVNHDSKDNFVMNTLEETEQAILDNQDNIVGSLIPLVRF